MFTIRIEKAETTCPDNITLTSGMVKAVKVAFDFSEEWEGFNKVAVFSNGTTTLDVSLDENDKAYVPHEVLEIPGKEVSVGVYGSKGEGEDYVAIPTEKCSLGKVVEGVDPTGEEPSEPTPSVWDEINLKVENLYRDVDLTKCTTITNGAEAIITENFISNGTSTVKFEINITGYCEIEIPLGSGTPSLTTITINGTNYRPKETGAISFKGVINKPITGTIMTSYDGMTFTKFVTTTDYELHNKVGDIDSALDEVEKKLDELPDMGGGGNNFVLIGDATLTEDAQAFSFTKDLEGNDLTKYKDFFMYFVGSFTEAVNNAFWISAYSKNIYLMYQGFKIPTAGTKVGFWHLIEEVIDTDGLVVYKGTFPYNLLTNYSDNFPLHTQGLSGNNQATYTDLHCNESGWKIDSLEFANSTSTFKAGSRCMLYGRLR